MLPDLNGAKFDILGKMANSAHTKKKIYVWETLPATNSQKGIFRVNVKVIRKGLISGVCMPNKVSITYGSKIVVNVKVDNRQTDRQDKKYAPIILSFGWNRQIFMLKIRSSKFGEI